MDGQTVHTHTHTHTHTQHQLTGAAGDAGAAAGFGTGADAGAGAGAGAGAATCIKHNTQTNKGATASLERMKGVQPFMLIVTRAKTPFERTFVLKPFAQTLAHTSSLPKPLPNPQA